MDEKCGQIGGGRAKTTGRVDVALLPTLARRDNVAELTAGYGFVIVDECHHVPAAAFSHVMNQIPARYWLGLTATPYRRDKLDSLIYHQLGKITHTISPACSAAAANARTGGFRADAGLETAPDALHLRGRRGPHRAGRDFCHLQGLDRERGIACNKSTTTSWMLTNRTREFFC